MEHIHTISQDKVGIRQAHIKVGDKWGRYASVPQSKEVRITVQHFRPEGCEQVALTLEELHKLVTVTEEELSEAEYRWHNPMTECCGKRKPREQLQWTDDGVYCLDYPKCSPLPNESLPEPEAVKA